MGDSVCSGSPGVLIQMEGCVRLLEMLDVYRAQGNTNCSVGSRVVVVVVTRLLRSGFFSLFNISINLSIQKSATCFKIWSPTVRGTDTSSQT